MKQSQIGMEVVASGERGMLVANLVGPHGYIGEVASLNMKTAEEFPHIKEMWESLVVATFEAISAEMVRRFGGSLGPLEKIEYPEGKPPARPQSPERN